MRYPAEGIPVEAGATEAFLFLFTAVIGVVVGIALVMLGRYGRQRWLVFSASTLIVASVTYMAVLLR